MKKLAFLFVFVLIISSFSVSAQGLFKINKGWNLISPGIFDNLVDHYGSDIKDQLISGIKGVHYFNPIDKTYISSSVYNHPNLGAGFPRNEKYPKALEQMQEILYKKTGFDDSSEAFSKFGIKTIEDKLQIFSEVYTYGHQSFWIYSEKEWSLEPPELPKHVIWQEGYLNKYPELFQEAVVLLKGWNLIAINPLMLEKTIDEFKGTCNMDKIYIFVSDLQEWQRVTLGESAEKDQIGGGLAINVKEDCILDFTTGSDVSQPPAIPDETSKSGSSSCQEKEIFNPYKNTCVNKIVICELDKDCFLLEGQTAWFQNEPLELTLISASKKEIGSKDVDKAIIFVNGGLGEVNLDTNYETSAVSFKDYNIVFESSDGDKTKIMGASFEVTKIN